VSQTRPTHSMKWITCAPGSGYGKPRAESDTDDAPETDLAALLLILGRLPLYSAGALPMQVGMPDRQPDRSVLGPHISELSLMTRLALVRDLAHKRVSANFFSPRRYFRGVTTVAHSPQTDCIREKTSSTLGVPVPLGS
jgi:hypothetical protein